MNLLSGFRGLFLTVLLLILSFSLMAQVLLSESFEGSFPTAGWTFVHLGGGFGWTQNYYTNTGTNNSKVSFAVQIHIMEPMIGLSLRQLTLTPILYIEFLIGTVVPFLAALQKA